MSIALNLLNWKFFFFQANAGRVVLLANKNSFPSRENKNIRDLPKPSEGGSSSVDGLLPDLPDLPNWFKLEEFKEFIEKILNLHGNSHNKPGLPGWINIPDFISGLTDNGSIDINMDIFKPNIETPKPKNPGFQFWFSKLGEGEKLYPPGNSGSESVGKFYKGWTNSKI